ncbi:DUF222 domain-containing protein [Gordonia sp. SID5947]|uniref:DUF222 domain-containing protein n=1 Tax=Gordonia sp. SID5947 TaxID=2690315 RepID=UPI0013681556|nr:DUF222 domain-containing protein [Gordonia sp. SID5947]MYR07508.1 DUF222 domain-containing protein [Gordonia sp. SID5947]
MSGPDWRLSSWWGEASPWPDLASLFTGRVHADDIGEVETNELLGSMAATQRGRAYLAWHDYRLAAELHHRLVGPDERPEDILVVDGFADCAARIALALSISQQSAEQQIREALALRDRLPQVSERLRDGQISQARVASIIARTDLLEGRECMADADAEIAAELDLHTGAWSAERLRDMVDRIVFRHDPDAVREARRRALNERRVWTVPKPDGVAQISATMPAENVRIAAASVRALAATACEHDRRTTQQRASDAMFALLSGTRFECNCGRADCTATIPGTGAVPPVDAKMVIHVVCDESTLTGEAEHAGFVAGHGVISDEHVRGLAARRDTVVKPLVPNGTPQDPDGTFVLPAHLPSDPYRPSTALDTYVRVRDGYSIVPGNATSAFDADIDHVREFDHANPRAGGQTVPENLNAKDRFSHVLKTFGNWLDEQFRDRRGRLRTEFTTPEGLVMAGDADNLESLFPGLRRIRFTASPAPPDTVNHQAPPARPTRSVTRVAAKHARRQQERERNRRRRERGSRGDSGCGRGCRRGG